MADEPVRWLIAGVAATLAVAVLAAIAARGQRGPGGWRALSPSPLHWTGLGLGTGLTLFMAWIRLFVGSSRPDGAQQMAILTGLVLAFGLLTLATAVAIVALRRRAVRWRGNEIAFDGPAGTERRRLDTIVAVGGNPLGQAVLTFADGTRLQIDPHATGAAALLERIDRARPD